MATEIINNGASIKIISGTSTRYITKHEIREIGIVRDTIIKLDLGEGPLYNVFIDHADVTNPVTATVEELRDVINGMLQSGISGNATEQKQDVEISELQALNTSVSDLRGKVESLNDKLYYEPSLQDENNPSLIYRGFAVPGSRTSDPVWAIQKVTNNKGILSYQWADGNKSFDNIWDNRATLTYL